ncbi:MAG: hypothetical protein NWF07_08490, partial [Candidatus Bathyarchaeota archaeon]|nr:hypothetical protein [Candidatus Bathyarchaeota archaeon]
ELGSGWDTDGLTFINPMLANETSYLLLTPALRFSDSNISQVVDGLLTVWEIYRWSNTSGVITYSFTSSDDITFDLLMHPMSPKQGDSIDFFTNSNARINNIQWVFPEYDWVNESNTLRLDGLKTGKYSITVSGTDDFDTSHEAKIVFTVSPPTLNPQSYDLEFFTVKYPETVSKGDQITISATIDYSMPTPAEIKCQLIDPVKSIVCKELVYSVSDSGSKQFNHQYVANGEGVEPLVMKLYYDVGGGWVEVNDAEKTMMITINVVNASTSIPGFNLISLISGFLLLVMFSRNQNND